MNVKYNVMLLLLSNFGSIFAQGDDHRIQELIHKVCVELPAKLVITSVCGYMMYRTVEEGNKFYKLCNIKANLKEQNQGGFWTLCSEESFKKIFNTAKDGLDVAKECLEHKKNPEQLTDMYARKCFFFGVASTGLLYYVFYK